MSTQKFQVPDRAYEFHGINALLCPLDIVWPPWLWKD